MEGKNCTLEILVHLEPTPREGWAGGADEERPLNELGMRQAERLAEEIGRVDAVFGSSALRCRQSVEPIATKSGVAVETVALNETGGNKAPVGWARLNAEGPDPLGGAYSAGTAATANTENRMSCVCQDGLNTNDTRPTSSAASPSQNMNTPGAANSSAIKMKPKISQFQLPRVVNIWAAI